MRFENNSNSDPNGIESIVNIGILSDQGLEVHADRIKVDYIYFNDEGGNKVCDVQNIDSDAYFVITTERLGIYEVDELNYSTTCPWLQMHVSMQEWLQKLYK